MDAPEDNRIKLTEPVIERQIWGALSHRDMVISKNWLEENHCASLQGSFNSLIKKA